MKKTSSIFLTLCVLLALLVPIGANAQDTTTSPVPSTSVPAVTEAPVTTAVEKPYLTQMSFEGATLVEPFQKEVFTYTLTVSQGNIDIKPASYKCSDNAAKVQVYYLNNKDGDATGLGVKVYNDSGANEYVFNFDIVKPIKKTADARLLSLSFNYGELSPAFDTSVFKYTLYLPSDLETLTLDAIPTDENATVTTPREIKLNQKQSSPLSIKVISSDGTTTLTYKLNIKHVKKTIAQIQKEMESPTFSTFVEIPFYQTAPFFIGTGCTVFAVALALVLFFTLRKKKQISPTTPTQEALIPTVPLAEESVIPTVCASETSAQEAGTLSAPKEDAPLQIPIENEETQTTEQEQTANKKATPPKNKKTSQGKKKNKNHKK